MADFKKLFDKSKYALKKPAIILPVIGIIFALLIILILSVRHSGQDAALTSEAKKNGSGGYKNSHVKKTGTIHGGKTESQVKFPLPDDKTTFDDILRFYASKDAPHRTSGEYETVVHRFLDITNPGNNHLLINTLIREAKTELELNSREYAYFMQGSYADTQEEAGLANSILTAIDTLFRSEIRILTREEYKKISKNGIEEYGYEVIADDPDNDSVVLKKTAAVDGSLPDPDDETIKSNELNSANNVMNYLAVGDVMQLPISFVPGMNHAYAAWKLSDGSYIYFDPELGKSVDESEYLKTVMHETLKEKGYYFNPLTTEETIGEAYTSRGEAYSESGDYIPAAQNFCKAIQLNPKNVYAYLMAVDSFQKANYDTEAKLIYNEAAKLNYGLLLTLQQ